MMDYVHDNFNIIKMYIQMEKKNHTSKQAMHNNTKKKD